MSGNDLTLPTRFADLKQEIAASFPEFKDRVTEAWTDILTQLKDVTAEITKTGSDVS